MSETLKLRPAQGTKALDVDVNPASDASYIDLVVSNARGEVAAVSLKLKGDDLVVHAEDWTVKEGLYPSRDARTIIDNVVVAAGALDAEPVGGESGVMVSLAAPFPAEPDRRDITGEAAQHCVAAAVAELAGAPPAGQGTRPKFCPHCGARDIEGVGGAHVERGEWDGREYETDGDAGAYQCQGCGAEFYVWDDGAGVGAEPGPLVHKNGSDYEMPEPGSFWVTVENISVYVIRHETGVSVSLCPRFPKGAEAEPAEDLASCAAEFADAPDEE